MAEDGLRTHGDLLHNRPEVPSRLSDIYTGFYLLDRDGMSGRATVGSMREVLDEMEVNDRYDRMRIIEIWRAMDHAAHRVYTAKREAKHDRGRRR